MAEFSISDAALTGFRVAREHPRAVLAWAGFHLVFSVVMQAVFVTVAGPGLISVLADPSQIGAAQAPRFLAQLARLAAVVLPLALVYWAVVLAAMNRIVLRPWDSRFGYLRLGRDELRQFGLVLLAVGVFFGIEFAVAIVAGFLIGIVGGTRATASALLGPLILVYGVVIVAAVRFSMASALTFERGRVDLFGSWRLTRGRFWPLLGVLALTVVLALVIATLGFVIIGALQLILSGGDMGALFSRTRSAPAGAVSPASLIALVLNAGVTALMWPILFTPAPEIYRALFGGRAAGAS